MLTLVNQSAGVVNGNDSTSALTVNATIVNSGVLEGTTAPGLVIIGNVSNSKLIEALGTSAAVVISGGTVSNASAGTILASGLGAHVDLLDGTIVSSGTLKTSGFNAVIDTASGGTATFAGGTVASGSVVDVVDGSTLVLSGTIVNSGTIELTASGDQTSLQLPGSVIADAGRIGEMRACRVDVGEVDRFDMVAAGTEAADRAAEADRMIENEPAGGAETEDDLLGAVGRGNLDAAAAGNDGGAGAGDAPFELEQACAGRKRAAVADVALDVEPAGGGRFHQSGVDDGVPAGVDGESRGGVGVDGAAVDQRQLASADRARSGDGVVDIAQRLARAVADDAVVRIRRQHDLAAPCQRTSGTLTVINGATSGSVVLIGAYTSGNFTLGNDGNGHVLITDPPVVAQKPGNASARIADGTVLEVDVADSGKVTFGGTNGTLLLDDASLFTGAVAGFRGLDRIDLAQIGFGAETTLGYAANAAGTGGTLRVSDGVRTASIALLGNYMAASFATAADGHGGTLITEADQAAHTPLASPRHA